MIDKSDFLEQPVFEKRIQRTLNWLEKSILAGGGGSAAYFHLWRGWSAPYPETTGYIIETLFDYAEYLKEDKWRHLAISCANWLCSIQRADGAFPGGAGVDGQPIIFDTGQILFGLTAAWHQTKNEKYRTALAKAVSWLLNHLATDGSWPQFAYVPGYVPAYYTRVIWAVLKANQVLQREEVINKMQQALDYHVNKITFRFSVENWSFAPGKAAFTHTIAYTLRGLLESSFLLNNKYTLSQTINIINKIIDVFQKKGRFAGKYDENWQGDYAFQCVTGDAQLSLLFARTYQITDKQIYLDTARAVFSQVAPKQWTFPVAGLCGAIPGSAPFWGEYQGFRFPNWAAKFYLDGYLLLRKVS